MHIDGYVLGKESYHLTFRGNDLLNDGRHGVSVRGDGVTGCVMVPSNDAVREKFEAESVKSMTHHRTKQDSSVDCVGMKMVVMNWSFLICFDLVYNFPLAVKAIGRNHWEHLRK